MMTRSLILKLFENIYCFYAKKIILLESKISDIFQTSNFVTGHIFAAPWPMIMNSSSFESLSPIHLHIQLKSLTNTRWARTPCNIKKNSFTLFQKMGKCFTALCIFRRKGSPWFLTSLNQCQVILAKNAELDPLIKARINIIWIWFVHDFEESLKFLDKFLSVSQNDIIIFDYNMLLWKFIQMKNSL